MKPLPSGAAVSFYYKKNKTGSWVQAKTADDVQRTLHVAVFPNGDLTKRVKIDVGGLGMLPRDKVRFTFANTGVVEPNIE